MITCPLCTKVFPSQSVLNYHMVSHTKEKPYKCHICSAAFGTMYDQKKHITRVHDGIKPPKIKNSQCSLCSYKCYNKTLLRNHLRIHSSEQPFSCNLPSCRFKTKYENNLQQHVRLVHSNERQYECPMDGCSYKGKSNQYLKQHLKFHNEDKPFACKAPGCNYTCKLNSSLAGHTARVHTDEKPFKCSTCDYLTNSKPNLNRHQHTHLKIKQFQCQAQNCGFASHQKGKLEEHFDRKHRNKDVSCTAPGCNVRCGTIALLKEHLKCHTEPLLKCPCVSCDFRSRLKRTLLSHISLRHKDFPKYQCHYPNCGYETTLQRRYDRHRITHNAEEKCKHVCTFCYSRFRGLSDLKIHLHTHTGEKPYRCLYCNYKTGRTLKLRQHVRRIHHVHVIPAGNHDKLRKCRTCNSNFWSNCELVLHSMSHLQPVVVLEKIKLETM